MLTGRDNSSPRNLVSLSNRESENGVSEQTQEQGSGRPREIPARWRKRVWLMRGVPGSGFTVGWGEPAACLLISRSFGYIHLGEAEGNSKTGTRTQKLKRESGAKSPPTPEAGPR